MEALPIKLTNIDMYMTEVPCESGVLENIESVKHTAKAIIQTFTSNQSAQAHQTHPCCCQWLHAAIFLSQFRHAHVASFKCYSFHLSESFPHTSPGDCLPWTPDQTRATSFPRDCEHMPVKLSDVGLIPFDISCNTLRHLHCASTETFP